MELVGLETRQLEAVLSFDLLLDFGRLSPRMAVVVSDRLLARLVKRFEQQAQALFEDKPALRSLANLTLSDGS